MELLIAILLALGALISPDKFNDVYVQEHPAEVNKAKAIIENNQYHYDQWGGVVIDDEVSTKQ